MSFRRSIRKTTEKRVHLPRDNTKLKVVNFLASREDGATRYEIGRKANIKKQDDKIFREILDEMVEINWIKKRSVSYGGGVTLYIIVDEGRKALEEAKGLLSKNHPLSKLSAFKDID